MLEKVGETSRGYSIYRERTEAGGDRYWSDAIGGGIPIWDTTLVSIEELEVAISLEKARLAPKPFGKRS